MEKGELIFKRKENYKGYNVAAWNLQKPDDQKALVEIFKGENIIRSFTFPAYKIYNIQAHFEDIVDSEIWKSISPMVRNPNYKDGYAMAAWNGIT